MTCKDAINSDTSSEDKELYLLKKSRSYNNTFQIIRIKIQSLMK